MEKQAPRRSISLSSRSHSTVPVSLPFTGPRYTSPLRRSPPTEVPRKPPLPDDDAAPNHGLWPSTSKKTDTLGDHFTNERRGIGRSMPSDSLSRQISSEFGKFEDKDKEEKGRRSKENRPMKYFGKLAFPRPSKQDRSPSVGSPEHGRMSVDENSLSLRRRSDIMGEIPRSELERGMMTIPEKSTPQKSAIPNYMKPTAAKTAMVDAMLTRSHSYRASGNQWALSPGRPVESPPTSSHGSPKSFSALRPRSPVKGRGSRSPGKARGVGNFMSSIGLDLFRKKPSPSLSPSSSLVSVAISSTPPPSAAGSPSRAKVGGGVAGMETSHQLKLLNNQLNQWRYLNAKSDSVNQVKSATAETVLQSAWGSISNLHASVVQNKAKLEKEKLRCKLTTIILSQMKALEGWADMEQQHFDGLSTTKNCLQSLVCRVPLVEGAKADSQIISIKLRHAADLATTVNTTISMFAPMDQSTVPLLHELTQVATREKALLEECFELLGLAAALQLREESLKCHLIEINSLQQQEISA